jgi:phosphotriesterase-related protein
MKTVMTVLGPIRPEELGVTLTHEHVFVDASANFVYQTKASALGKLHAPIEISMIGTLRRRPFSTTLDNVVLSDEATAISELLLYKNEGGGALVDCTVIGVGRDPEAVRRVSRATGLHIIQGTGIYVERSHPDWVRSRSTDELADQFKRDIQVGIDETGVRAGILGEIGVSGSPKGRVDYGRTGEITEEEERVLRAAGRASVATGAAVSLHLDGRGRAGTYVFDVLAQEGVAPDRMIMGHIDIAKDPPYQLRLAEKGVYLEFDTFGREYYSEEIGVSRPSDTQRIEYLKALLDAGFVRQILFSQDICLKMDLRRYGGHGYNHILLSVLPMLRRAGIGDDTIRTILVENPMRALAFGA